ncbi:MAG TPA: DUF433 domain-containing protein [Anaerolineae bacterium]|nr:DUF433 domain-containing protein [Anaerolineae bacterium]
MERVDIGKYIVIDPEICHGQMTFKDTRVPVDTVLTFLAKGYSVDVLLHSWPELSRPAIEEAVSLASQSLQARYAPYVSAAAATSQYDYPVIA